MMRFEKNIDDRKKLVARLKELTGHESRYSGVPYCVYYIGDYTVAKDGSIEVEEEKADMEVLNTLISEGMLKERETEEPEQEEAEATEEQEETVEEETEPEPAEEPTGEEAGEPQEEEPQTEEEPETEEPQNEGDTLTITFPTANHTGTTLRNLIFMVYSRGPLINKALGSHFSVSEGLVEALKDDKCTVTPIALREAVAAYEGEHGSPMTGIQLKEDEISLYGFPFDSEAEDGDADKVKACTDLAALMNRMALTQKRIQAKTVNDDNEKYAMRIWLVRLGMGGADYKTTRGILLENLGGNCAFRTEEEAEKFKAKEKAKRDKLKAAKAAEAANTEEVEADE